MFKKLKNPFKKPQVPSPVVSEEPRGVAPTPEGGEEFPFEYIFAPLQEFEWAQEGRLIGHYVVGCTYNVTKNPVHAALRQKAFKWAQEGKIEIFPLAGGVRFVMTKPGA